VTPEFQRRLALLDPQDALWVGVRRLLADNAAIETEALCRPNLGDEEAHRQRGRLSMLLDLQQQLDDAVAMARKEGASPS
jgi:hypothetical protein